MTFLSRFTTSIQCQVRSTFRLSGVYTNILTPFMSSKDDFTVDFARFDQLIRHLNRYPVAGLGFLASLAEFVSIALEKKIDLIEHAREQLGHNRTIIAGAGLVSAYDTVYLVRHMAEAGADACFVYNPTYFRDRVDAEDYLKYFGTIADVSPVPIILYNIPSHKDVDIPIDVVVDLAKHPNIVGLLDNGGNIIRIATICKRTSGPDMKNKPFDVLCGSACFYLPALLSGCSGVMCSLANILPFEIARLDELVKEGKMEQALQLQWRLLEPNDAITDRYGIAGLKAVLRTHLDIDTGSVKVPLLNLTPQQVEDCLQIFYNNDFLLSKRQRKEECSANNVSC